MFVADIAAGLAAATGLAAEDVRAQLSVPPNAKMGDYAFPCFALAKAQRRNPKDLAAELAAKVSPGERVREARAFGPYVNFFINPTMFIADVLAAVRAEGDAYGHGDEGAGRTVVLDFSSPNIAKHLGVHHLRSTMIGNALRNIHAALGYRTIAINHLGDWGTQFGQLAVAYDRWGDNDPLDEGGVDKLNTLYVRFHAEAENDPALHDQAREAFRRIEDGEPHARELWQKFRAVSLEEFRRVYDLLGVCFDSDRGEAHYAPRGREIVGELKEKRLATISEDATIIDLDAYGMPPVLLLKGDGSTLYHTRDIAAAIDRWQTWRFEKMIYVTDMGQSLHFKQLFKVLELMGFNWAARCRHVAFGRMLGMSTRKGQVVLLEDVLKEGVRRAGEVIAAKNPELADAAEVARMVAVAAVVFNDLKNKRVKDVVFDWDDALSFEGETGPYLQYTHARLCSILRKYGRPAPAQVDATQLGEAEELAVAKEVARLTDVLRRAADECEPSLLASYLLTLAAETNHYYHQHHVLGEDAALAAARIALVDAVRQTLANGLALLGLGAPKEM